MNNSSMNEQQREIIRTYQNQCSNYVIPVFIADNISKVDSKVYSNGTATFIDTGMKKILVTNEHVIREYREQRIQHTDLNFYLGSLVIDVEDRLIDINKDQDLATLTIEPEELTSLGKECCSCVNWPPDIISSDEVVMFIGFPGIFRRLVSTNVVRFESAIIVDDVTSSSPGKFTIHMDFSDYFKFSGLRDADELTDIGGFSGAGVFKFKDSGLMKIVEPAGIIFEGSSNLNVQLAKHIGFINADGTINDVL